MDLDRGGAVVGLHVDASLNLIASGSYNVYLWDAVTGAELLSCDVSDSGPVHQGLMFDHSVLCLTYSTPEEFGGFAMLDMRTHGVLAHLPCAFPCHDTRFDDTNIVLCSGGGVFVMDRRKDTVTDYSGAVPTRKQQLAVRFVRAIAVCIVRAWDF